MQLQEQGRGPLCVEHLELLSHSAVLCVAEAGQALLGAEGFLVTRCKGMAALKSHRGVTLCVFWSCTE